MNKVRSMKKWITVSGEEDLDWPTQRPALKARGVEAVVASNGEWGGAYVDVVFRCPYTFGDVVYLNVQHIQISN